MTTVEPLRTVHFKLSGGKTNEESGRSFKNFVDEIEMRTKPFGGGAKFTSADIVEIYFQVKFTDEVNKIIDSARGNHRVTLSDAESSNDSRDVTAERK